MRPIRLIAYLRQSVYQHHIAAGWPMIMDRSIIPPRHDPGEGSVCACVHGRGLKVDEQLCPVDVLAA